MATGKKFYWLKLSRDFFKRHDVRIIESQDNGKDYILFYLKLLVESIDHEGELRFNDTIPYDEKMLATITNTNIDIVRQAIKVFTGLGLMEIFDDHTIYLTETAKMLGHETDWARKKREYRKQKRIANEDNVPKVSLNSLYNVRQEIEKEEDIELDKEKDLDKDSKEPKGSMSVKTDSESSSRINWNDIKNYWNENSNLTEVRSITEKRKKHLNARIKEHSLSAIYETIDQVKESKFMHGENNRKWMATFDWVFSSPNNFLKTLEGNYSNKDIQNKNTWESDVNERVKRMNEYMGVKS
jgi:predicted phage replisome organizer